MNTYAFILFMTGILLAIGLMVGVYYVVESIQYIRQCEKKQKENLQRYETKRLTSIPKEEL